MMLASELIAPPIVGRTYLVPAIWMARYGDHKPELWWPVHGSLHADAEFFDFKPMHYHVDQRFLTRKHITQLGNHDDIRGWGPIGRSFAAPVHGKFAHVEANISEKQVLPPEPELRRMRCTRVMPDHPFQTISRGQERNGQHPMDKLESAFAGLVAKRGRLGFVCPHQQYPLGQVTPDASGILTCPLHGLRIRASDGVCVPHPSCGDHDNMEAA